MSQALHDDFSWEVILPKKHETSWGGWRPRGTVVVESQEGGSERLAVPKAVARVLAAKRSSGELLVTCRNDLLNVIDATERSCARLRIERLIDRREYATSEVLQKLRDDGYSDEVSAQCVGYATEIGLISNKRYADMFVRSKLSAGWGMARIERELKKRSIDPILLDGWPYEYLDPEDEQARATEVALRHRVHSPHAREKMIRYLCGKGFALSVATRVSREVVDD